MLDLGNENSGTETDLGNITEGENEEALDNNKELSRIINGNPALLDLVMEIHRKRILDRKESGNSPLSFFVRPKCSPSDL